MTETTAALLSAVGTREFHRRSVALYGAPGSPIADGKRTALDLARRLDGLLADLEGGMRLEPPVVLDAPEIKRRLDAALPAHFGADAPRIEVTRNESGKAAAGRDYIKLREDAMFSDLDVTQLLQHEAFVHIATGKNGQAQAHFPCPPAEPIGIYAPDSAGAARRRVSARQRTIATAIAIAARLA